MGKEVSLPRKGRKGRKGRGCTAFELSSRRANGLLSPALSSRGGEGDILAGAVESNLMPQPPSPPEEERVGERRPQFDNSGAGVRGKHIETRNSTEIEML